MRKNDTLKFSVALFTAGMMLWACGRPSTSRNFEFDGVGDPRIPTGNIIQGEYAGTVEMTRWKTTASKYQSFTGSDLPLVQGLFNGSSIEGLAGLGLLVVSTAVPMDLGDPRLNGGNCYYDLGVSPILGGDLNTLDLGEQMRFHWGDGGSGNRQAVIRDDDSFYQDPTRDLIFYVSNFDAINPAIPDGDDVYVTWSGGTLAGRGYPVAPPRVSELDVLFLPEEVTGPAGEADPTINGSIAGTEPIPTADGYTIEWEQAASDKHLVGMNVTLQVYGPANLGTVESPQVEDLPYFNRLGQLVCTVDDSEEEFTISQAQIDDLMARVMETKAYADSTEDVNGDGVISPKTGPIGNQAGEDGNGNGVDDKVYGAALIINRRTDNEFLACTRGPSEEACTRAERVYISGNATKYYPMQWAIPE